MPACHNPRTYEEMDITIPKIAFQASQTWDFFDKLKILAVQEEVKKAFTFYEKGM